MESEFPLVLLREVLTQDQKYVDIPESRIYPKLSVKLYGKGVVLDEPVDGLNLKMKRHQLARAGQVILSEIWGKKGAIGFVPPEGDGALCTSHFFLFDVQTEKILPKYLQAIFTANFLEAQLNNEARGSTGYAAVRPKHLLSATIPLPSLAQQHHIVAYIEGLTQRILEAQGLRQGSLQDTKSFMLSELDKLVLRLERQYSLSTLQSVTCRICDMNHEMPKAVEHGVPLISPLDYTSDGISYESAKRISYEDFERLRKKCQPQKGDILLTRYGAGYGNLRIVDVDNDFLASYSIAVISPNREYLTTKFLYWMIMSPHIQEQASQGIRASAMPDLGIKTIREFLIPIPPLDEQYEIVDYLDDLQSRVNAIKQLQFKAQEELDALLPAILDKAFKGEL